MIAVILNPIAGGRTAGTARARVELARTALEASPEPFELFVTERKGHARELASAAAARGARVVAAWGGDGTVNEVASALVGGPVHLGIVPAGSGNGLARRLGISQHPRLAVSGALGGTPRRIDAGELGGHLFFSVAGVGFDAHVAACFDRDLAGRRGLAGYASISARELLTYRCGTYRIVPGAAAPDGDMRAAFLVTLANSGQWGNGARIAPDAALDDGQLDLVVLEERSRLQTICGLPRLFTGTIARMPGVSSRRVERVWIESDQPILFHVDGEVVLGGQRLEGRVHPGVLSVVVP